MAMDIEITFRKAIITKIRGIEERAFQFSFGEVMNHENVGDGWKIKSKSGDDYFFPMDAIAFVRIIHVAN